MCEHEQVHCPRCMKSFECKAGSILLCQCMTVTLDHDEREYIAKAYDGCLCADCMKHMKAAYHDGLFRNKLNKISVLFKTPEDPQ
jgi:hypothetical protein